MNVISGSNGNVYKKYIRRKERQKDKKRVKILYVNEMKTRDTDLTKIRLCLY